MGPKLTHASADDSSNLSKSKFLQERRKNRKVVISNLIKRVLSSPLNPQDPICLPESVLISIFEYIPYDTVTLLSVSATWYFRWSEVIEHCFNPIESGFANMHSHLITFKKSFLYYNKIQASGREGFRVDRVLVAEVLPILKGYTMKLRYTYKYYKSEIAYSAEFKIDCVDKGKRILWVHRDEARNQGKDENVKAYSQQVPRVCVGDNIEVCINLLSLFGLLRLGSIAWQPPILQNSKVMLKSLSLESEDEIVRKKLHLFKVSRVCEVEINCSEWYDSKYYPVNKQASSLEGLSPFLKLLKFEFTGCEVVTSKLTFRAETPGVVPESLSTIGIWVEVVNPNSEVRLEVRRLGLLYDRQVPIRLRVGDELVVYVSR
jgi:hypothetical protein